MGSSISRSSQKVSNTSWPIDRNRDATSLVREFHCSMDEFAKFQCASAGSVPEPCRKLLDHDAHMTSTVEQHHGCPVDLKVLGRRHDYPAYRHRRETIADARRPRWHSVRSAASLMVAMKTRTRR